MIRFVAGLFSVAMMALGVGGVSGQTYPNKPIHIVTSEAGGSIDFAARLIAQGISAPLGQPVTVDNRPALVANETAAKAPPDGYTLLFVGSTMWLAPFLRDNVPYDPVRDFSPITLGSRAPNILVVTPSLPVNSVKELITLAKARPGELNYVSTSIGGPIHLSAELFKSMAGVNIVRIPYKGSAQALNALIGGEVQLMFSTSAPVTPHIKSGKLRALAVTSAEPSLLFPDLSTVAASGLPGYESTQLTAIFAPAKTLASIVNRLNQEIVRVLNQVEVRKKFLNAGAEAVGSSPEQLSAAMKSEMLGMGKVIKDAGIREQ